MDNSSMERYLGQMLDGRYEIVETIGRGGMAWVFKAHDHLLNRNVAIKILRDDMAADSDFRLHFKKEAQAVAKLSHANIVSIHDVSRIPKMDYIVMELIEGVTLKQYMKTKGQLGPKETAHFAAQIAKALAHAHEKGIVHRDIKPQNIMIGMDGRVKVADFGIAYLESALGENKNLTVGSVHYISPEQARGLPADARSDLYSLGVVMYEMLSGQLPFDGDSPDEVAKQHLSAAPIPLEELCPDVPEALELIVEKAMNPDINQRYQTAEELLDALESYLASTSPVPEAGKAPAAVVLPNNPPPISRSGELSREAYLRRHRRSSKVSLLTGILLVLVFAVALFAFLWNYWLRDLFADPIKISIDDLVGLKYEDVINNEELQKKYNFEVTSRMDPDVEAGIIIAQDPAAGRPQTLDSGGIDINLIVSAGAQMITVPDVVNQKYTDAVTTLEKSGFKTEKSFVVSDNVTKDYVIATHPGEGDALPVGSTVTVEVSVGPNIVSLQMPNLVGLTEAIARQRIEGANLAFGGTTYLDDEDWPAGYVTWQNIQAGATVNEHTLIFIQVSTGPEETDPPEETDVRVPTATTAPTAAPAPAVTNNPSSNSDLNP